MRRALDACVPSFLPGGPERQKPYRILLRRSPVPGPPCEQAAALVAQRVDVGSRLALVPVQVSVPMQAE